MECYCILSRVDSQCCVAFRRTAPDSLPLFYYQARTMAARAAQRVLAVCLSAYGRTCVCARRVLAVCLSAYARVFVCGRRVLAVCAYGRVCVCAQRVLAVCLRMAARVCVHGECSLSVCLRMPECVCVTLPRPRCASGSRVCVLCPCVCVCFVNKVICGVCFGLRI